MNRECPRRRVTITEVAAALGVTPATVSNAFNHPDQLSSALRERVFATATAMGYLGPDAAARSMRRGRTRTVGVLYSDPLSNAFADPAFVLFLQGLAGEIEGAGMAITLLSGGTQGRPDPAPVDAAVVDGLIIYSMADDDPRVAAARNRRLPIVLVDSPRLPAVPYVGIDDDVAARTAADHLVRLGHRSFGIIAGELGLDRRSGAAPAPRQAAATYGVNRARLHGYEAALTAAGLDWNQIPVEETDARPDDAGRAAADRLVRRHQRPTALLAMSDRLARGALAAAGELGLAVPSDLSIVGFDDDPEAARSSPALTTVRQPHEEKGRLAGELLIAQLEGKGPADPALLATEVVVRGSTAPPPDHSSP